MELIFQVMSFTLCENRKLVLLWSPRNFTQPNSSTSCFSTLCFVVPPSSAAIPPRPVLSYCQTRHYCYHSRVLHQ